MGGLELPPLLRFRPSDGRALDEASERSNLTTRVLASEVVCILYVYTYIYICIHIHTNE